MRKTLKNSPPPVPGYTRTKVMKIRRRTKASRTAFGTLLNVGTAKVVAWENGTAKPRGPEGRLLDIVDRKGIQILF